MLSIGLIALLGCGKAFDNPCENGECPGQEKVEEVTGLSNFSNTSGSIGTGTGSSSTTGFSAGSNTTPISVGSTGSSSLSGSISTSGSGGFSDASGSGSSGSFNNDYDQYDSQTDNFMIFEQLTDKVVETENYFYMQYGVSGQRPLKFEWFKKQQGGADKKIGEDRSYFYVLGAKFSDSGRYYVKVTDAKGRTVTSRVATIHVVQGRAPCDGKVYGPTYSVSRNGSLDWNYLEEDPFLGPREEWALQKIAPLADSGFYFLKCNYRVGGLSYCNGTMKGFLQYQCQNGRYKRIYNRCSCTPFDGGGG